jgi:hypothetical protein
MFSEITRIRPDCARRPEVAMPIERAKSFVSVAMLPLPYLSAVLLALRIMGQALPIAVFSR